MEPTHEPTINRTNNFWNQRTEDRTYGVNEPNKSQPTKTMGTKNESIYTGQHQAYPQKSGPNELNNGTNT